MFEKYVVQTGAKYLLVSHTMLILYETCPMSDRVSKLIDSIKGKANELHQDLQSERNKSASLENELTALKSELNAKSLEIQTSKDKLAQLGGQLKTLSEQKVDQQSSGADISDEQIDELVREIEFCIAQLKQ